MSKKFKKPKKEKKDKKPIKVKNPIALEAIAKKKSNDPDVQDLIPDINQLYIPDDLAAEIVDAIADDVEIDETLAVFQEETITMPEPVLDPENVLAKEVTEEILDEELVASIGVTPIREPPSDESGSWSSSSKTRLWFFGAVIVALAIYYFV